MALIPGGDPGEQAVNDGQDRDGIDYENKIRTEMLMK